MNFKDLKQRCVIDIEHYSKNDHTFYFQPDSILLDRPEQQSLYREQLLNRICSIPKPEPIMNIADELHRQCHQILADQSTPGLTKRNLAAFFQRRQYQLQHLKYKLLCRWAHFSLTTEQLEKNSTYATVMYGKLEFNLEQAMARYERLSQDDRFEDVKAENKPKTKSEDGGSLYMENEMNKPQSLIREDDVEVYLRDVTYKNKLKKVINKFLARLKWIALQDRFDIYQKALIANDKLKRRNIKRQQNYVEKLKAQMRRLHTQKRTMEIGSGEDFENDKHLRMTPELELELKDIVSTIYIQKYEGFHPSRPEKIQSSWMADHETVPDFVSNIYTLKIKITEAAKELMDFVGNIELDQGYSYAYNISTSFPSYFQKQVIKSQFSLYDALSLDIDKNKEQQSILTNILKVDSNIFRDIYTVKNEVPSDEALKLDVKSNSIKVIRLKSCGFWIDYVCLTPSQTDWDRKQESILTNHNPVDTLLANGMNMLDTNDLQTINKVHEELAQLH